MNTCVFAYLFPIQKDVFEFESIINKYCLCQYYDYITFHILLQDIMFYQIGLLTSNHVLSKFISVFTYFFSKYKNVLEINKQNADDC